MQGPVLWAPFSVVIRPISVGDVNEVPRSWLLPSALVTYVALSAVLGPTLYGGPRLERSSLLLALTVSAPLVTAWLLRVIQERTRLGQLSTKPRGPRWFVLGLGLWLSTLTARDGQPALLAVSTLGSGLLTIGALLATAQVIAAPSILKDHPAAASRDALWTSVIMWSSVATVYALRAGFPQTFPLDPIALKLATLYASLGSLLLLIAVVLRLKLLRGLQLGIFDRTWSALAITCAGIVVGAGAGFILLDSTERVVGWVLAFTCSAVTLAMAYPDPSRVTRSVRGVLAALTIGTPTCLVLLWATSRGYLQSAPLTVLATSFGVLLGVFTRRLTQPLLPDGSRWRDAMEHSLEASLHPEPDVALRDALLHLRAAEPASGHRPEIFRLDPPGLLSVDIAGYLDERSVEFPQGIAEAAAQEPLGTLRAETLALAQVRTPFVRPLLQWFEAQQAKTASVLSSEGASVGLLLLPRGKRRSPLSMEEALLLSKLCRRLAGLMSVTSALKRSRARELSHQQSAQAAQQQVIDLSDQLRQSVRHDRLETQRKVEILRRTAHSPAAQVTMIELESHAESNTIQLQTQVGVDPVPWAAHVHLARFSDPLPLIVFDLRRLDQQVLDLAFLKSEASPLYRAHTGTLVLLHPGVVDASAQESLGVALNSLRPRLLISCSSNFAALSPLLERELKGPSVRIPTLAERSEDLQALIINELSEQGIERRGAPFGIERAALLELIERDFFGNEEELRGLVAALSGRCEGDRVTLSELHEVLGMLGTNVKDALPSAPFDPIVPRRSRARLPPRSRRH